MKYFVIILILIGFAGSAFAAEPDIPPPLKQMKLGIKLGHIICDPDKIPTWNVHFKPACVFPDSEMKLIKRGWAKLRLMLPGSADPIKELEILGTNELSMRILGNLRVGDEPPPSTLDEKRELAWEYSQKYHPGERYLEYSIPTSHMYHFNLGEKIEFDLLEWGNFSECWDVKLRIFDNHYEVLYEDTLSKVCLEPDGKPGTFNSYSVGKDFELVCKNPGYYLIEVSNGEIFPPTILQNFACLNKSKSVSLTEQFKDIPEVKAFFAKYDDANVSLRNDHVSYYAGNEDGFLVRMNLFFDKNYELDHIDFHCYFQKVHQFEFPQEDIISKLEKYDCKESGT